MEETPLHNGTAVSDTHESNNELPTDISDVKSTFSKGAMSQYTNYNLYMRDKQIVM